MSNIIKSKRKIIFLALFIFSISLNLIVAIHYAAVAKDHPPQTSSNTEIHYAPVAKDPLIGNSEVYKYTENPQYMAYLTMFSLNSNEADYIFLGDSITARGHWDEFFQNKKVLKSEQIASNMSDIVFTIHSSLPDSRIYIESILPQTVLSDFVIQETNIQYKDIANNLDYVEYIDLYEKFMDGNGNIKEGYLSEDGVHITGFGYKEWCDAISKYIQ